MTYGVVCGDVLEVLPTLGHFDCLIADPPDNIGLKYEDYEDNYTENEYVEFLTRLMDLSIRHADTSWISFNAKWLMHVGAILYSNTSVLHKLAPWQNIEHKFFMQTFTFGQNRQTDCGNGYRPLLRLRHKDAPLYPEAIKVPSWRQLNGDKRAAEGGRVPLDVWDIPRVTGNSKQRRPWHPTQLNEKLVKRIIDLSTKPGDTILDAFSGTGTVRRVAKDRKVTSIELSRTYCEKIAEEHNLDIHENTTIR